MAHALTSIQEAASSHVTKGQIIYRSESAPVPGWAWSSGARVAPDMEAALTYLMYTHLIDVLTSNSSDHRVVFTGGRKSAR